MVILNCIIICIYACLQILWGPLLIPLSSPFPQGILFGTLHFCVSVSGAQVERYADPLIVAGLGGCVGSLLRLWPPFLKPHVLFFFMQGPHGLHSPSSHRTRMNNMDEVNHIGLVPERQTFFFHSNIRLTQCLVRRILTNMEENIWLNPRFMAEIQIGNMQHHSWTRFCSLNRRNFVMIICGRFCFYPTLWHTAKLQ